MPRGRPSTRGTPITPADASRDTSTASNRVTRSARTRSQAASSIPTPASAVDLPQDVPSGPRPRGRPRKSIPEVEASPLSQFPTSDIALPTKRRGRPSKAPAIESESVSSVPTPLDPDTGSDYSTPASSKVPTPAAVDHDKSAIFEVQLPAPSTSRLIDRERGLRKSAYAMNSRGQGRMVIQDSDDEDLDNSRDAQVARRLQDEELKQPSSAASSSFPLRRSTRPSLSGSFSTPAQSSVKRERASTLTDSIAKRGRPAKKPKVIPDSDDEDIDMDAEIAQGLDLDSGSSLSSFEDETFADDDASDEGAVQDISSDDEDVPMAMSRKAAGKRPARPMTRTVPRVKAPTTTGSRSAGKASQSDGPSGDELDALENALGDADSTDFATDNNDGYIDLSSSDADADDADNTDQIRGISNNRRAFRNTGVSSRTRRERERLEKHHPEIITMWDKIEKEPVIKAGKAAQPERISRQLKPFQLEGLAWMMEMEKTKYKGGLLGDEMGLGKTIQAVSLIMSDYRVGKPSLVLVPPVALMQWQQEIKSYTDGALNTFVFHGTNQKTKGITVRELKKFDVIMMSYNSLESVYRKQEKGFKRKDGIYKEKSAIHAIDFHRVILDEAHCIKTRTTMTAKACFALKTTYRWCLTGTPLQNRIGEFFSLVRFLEIDTFASYLCKQCPCSTLEWSMDEHSRCTGCKHPGVQHVSLFNQELLNPIQKYGNKREGATAFKRLHLMTERIMLRRLKKDHTNSMELPVKEVYVDRQFFGEEENDFANSIMTNGQRKFDTYVAQGVLLNNYANIFGLIMQMRQVADHPDLITKKNAEGGQNVLVCCICDEPAEDAIRSRCKHDFCRACVGSYVRSTDEPDCPRCHIPLSIDLEQPEMEQDENLSIIFSQFTTMLQLIEWRLRRAGITTVMLDGSMTPAQRQASIEHFMNNVDVECFLVSLKAGGVALNLTEASRVFIVDPWWNPAAEWQSADRCHRIGQTRPCTITRLCIEDSVESRMVLIQEKKTNMIHSTVNSDTKAMESLTPQDMQFLFRGT
ncbi:probable nucleotide exsicion repair protein RAD16 [Fusarium fujikuroi IMI 58289]|uniref:Probable nucleotide exsicion repair protein RAD16 n=1 Tax=Gibberella fujikuroi (strain CBS 195.34 / IMI 58289 / NRRL A-6831) TaxID=1279085 RepID=S0DWI6_GIBF5|nr:probable nucleotide exsicion repair protein RAD16 [Fusarium fujikuroi IMI 58289]KLO96489.1 putative nucleotide exsicion repair protein RAD16 [Fusarium fujikuroi]KLO96643.1 putative nucleotide exsicion repair protein RAD16 [Fusarium fujikuroi]KLP20215.1 putative nucleotide exsicion repair protein RAD16 [Fusarium fujikuroi]CCT66919.1 probable nucleotide exsicion repair protein RAD16 [Fusarium fujikuroi IMI 58289]